MNKYETYMDLKKYFEYASSLEAAKEYIYETTKEQRFYLTTKLAGMFDFILKQKEYQENLKSKPKYSDEDIEFLKELSILDLTHDEAFLTKQLDEHYKVMMHLSAKLYYSSPKVKKAVDEEAKRLEENCTPRLLVMAARRANKK